LANKAQRKKELN